jgi:hypothetical protein
MKAFFTPVCFVFALLMLASVLYFWGGLVGHPQMGDAINQQLTKNSFLLWLYGNIGSGILDFSGLQPQASADVGRQVGSVFPAMKNAPYTALETLLAVLPLHIKISQYLGPVLLVLASVVQLRKPKAFKTYR